MDSCKVPPPEALRVFETLPDLYLVLSPNLVILTASNAYLKASMTERENIVGRPLFEVFPDRPGEDGVLLTKTSLRQVLTTRQPHQMDTIRYDLVSPGQPHHRVERYWSVAHTPVMDEGGTVQYIVHRADDVTEQVKSRQKIEQSQQKVQALNQELRTTNEELTRAKTTLEQLNSKLEERVAARTQEARQAQQEAEQQRERLERLFMQAPAIVNTQIGPKHVFELVHPLTYQLLGDRPLVGKSMQEALPELEGPFPELLDQVYQTGEPFYGKEVQARLNRHGNQEEPVEAYFNLTYQPIVDAAEQVEGVMTFAVEVTDQVLARQNAEQLARKVEEQAQTFHRTLTALQDFVYTFDPHGRFTYANQPLLGLLGISLDEILGKSFHELPYPRELADTLLAHIDQVVSTGQPLTDETPYTSPTGESGYYEYIFKPIFDQQQQVVLVAGSTRDITERKQAEETLRLKNEELIRTNVDLDNFIYTASHDLKAPISNIEALLTALLRTLPAESQANPRTQRITDMMQASVERFKRTIANLTEIVKLQKANSGPAVSVNLAEVVREVRLDLESMIRSSGVELTTKIDEDLSVQFSEKNLRSVVYNLVSNAIKYCSPDRVPHVLIESESQPEYQVLMVQDNGLGMETGRLGQLFTMFKRFHDHVEGTGIGLYMVKKMVENAGGKIEVDSRLGEGSTFRVYFRR